MWASYGFGFSQNLKRLRQARGLSQQALADIAEISRNQISNLERNRSTKRSMSDPALSTVYKLALALEIPPALLLPGTIDSVTSLNGDDEPVVADVDDIAPFPKGYIARRRDRRPTH